MSSSRVHASVAKLFTNSDNCAGRAKMACDGGSFVALVSGETFATGATCLKRQLHRVGSVCPLVLVHGDRPGFALTPATQQRLEKSFGYSSLLPLTTLIGRMAQFSNSTLVELSSAVAKHMLKLYLWALPRERF